MPHASTVFAQLFWAAWILAATCPPARADSIDDLLVRVARDAHIPGVAVAIVQNGKIVKLASYGQASTELGVPVSQGTRFQIASTTKLYTSALLLRMVEQRALSLDDPITRFIPGAPRSWQAITIRNLANHTSGLGMADIDPATVKASDAVAALMKASANPKPGQVAQYDSLDFTVLQAVLERAGGETFSALLQHRLLSPAGLTCTSFDNATQMGPQRRADPVPGRAEYYHWNGVENQRAWFFYTQYAYAAGGAYSCISDLARFIASIDAGTLLKPESLAASWAPPKLANGATGSYGIGWVMKSYRGVAWAGHSGGPAFSDVMYFPSRHLGIVVLTNQQRLYPQLASLIADRFLPAPQNYANPGIADAAPKLTNAALRFLAGAAKGAADLALLRPQDRADVASDWNDVAPGWIGLLGPVTRIVLVHETRASDGSRSRDYRVFYGPHAQGFRFTFNSAGLIADIDTAETM